MSKISTPPTPTPTPTITLGQRVSDAILGSMERFFYRFGESAGHHPWRNIFACLALVAFSCAGVLRFHQEKNPAKLWVPSVSDFHDDAERLFKLFDTSVRQQTYLVTAPDVLQPEVLRQVAELHRRVIEMAGEDGTKLSDICLKVPVLSFNIPSRRRRGALSISLNLTSFGDDADANDEDDEEVEPWTTPVYDPDAPTLAPYVEDEDYETIEDIYCDIANNLTSACYTRSVLDMWKYDVDVISRLTKQEIIDALDITTYSPTLGHPTDFTSMLGMVKRDAEGRVVSAGALMTTFQVAVNVTNVDIDKTGNNAGTAQLAAGPDLIWEKAYLALMENASREVQGMELFYEAARSFADTSEGTIFQDLDKLMVGVLLMYVYVQVVLSKRNWVELRVYLATAGLLSIGLAYLTSVGLCSLAGIPYGPVHAALPFLLLGIGVDDVFVIGAAWRATCSRHPRASMPRRLGLTMRKAGTAITITSLTNAGAFFVGASTLLPSLQSFCLYAATGVVLTYIFQTTLFTACLALDERRVLASRHSLLPCLVMTRTLEVTKDTLTDGEPKESWAARAFRVVYSRVVFTKVGRAFVILLAICTTSASIKGNLDLKQKFDIVWFLPQTSPLYHFFETRRIAYPEGGGQWFGVYMGAMDYGAELPEVARLVVALKNERPALIDQIDEWHTPFALYANRSHDRDVTYGLSEEDFSDLLTKFLFAPEGARYQDKFRFSGPLRCGSPAPPITVSSISLNFRKMSGPLEQVPAMNRIKRIARSANFTTGERYSTAWTQVFAYWLTDEVLGRELYHNLALCCACVMVCTALLIVNATMCLLIFLCVVLTLVNVAGMMHFWGLTIEVTSSIGLQLAAGLCVDYAAHVGHAFLAQPSGSRVDRALNTVAEIGPAVANGGLSTLLALSVLSNSKSYVFLAFFKIFSLVVTFGLFHGLVLLPVLLTFIGPATSRDRRASNSSTVNSVSQQVDNKMAAAADDDLEDDVVTVPPTYRSYPIGDIM